MDELSEYTRRLATSRVRGAPQAERVDGLVCVRCRHFGDKGQRSATLYYVRMPDRTWVIKAGFGGLAVDAACPSELIPGQVRAAAERVEMMK